MLRRLARGERRQGHQVSPASAPRVHPRHRPHRCSSSSSCSCPAAPRRFDDRGRRLVRAVVRPDGHRLCRRRSGCCWKLRRSSRSRSIEASRSSGATGSPRRRRPAGGSITSRRAPSRWCSRSAAALIVLSLLRWDPGAMVDLRGGRLHGDPRAAGAARAGGAAAALLRDQAADARALRERLVALADKAGTRVLGVFEWRLSDRTQKGERRAGRHRPHAADPAVRHAARRALGRRDRSDPGARARAPRLSRHLVGDCARDGADRARLLSPPIACSARCRRVRGLEGKGDVAGLPLLVLAAGAVSLALMPVSNALSRAHERRADRYALR